MHIFQAKGFSAVAALAITAVIVGGGAVAWSVSNFGSSQTDTKTQSNATSAESAMAGGANVAATTTFACNQGKSAQLTFAANQKAELTLPSGETVSVSRTQTNGETSFVNSDQSIELRNESEGAVIEKSGEVVVDGCIQAGARTQAGGTSSPTESQAETGLEADVQVDTEMNSEASETNVGNDTTATGSATTSQPVGSETEADVQLNTEVQTQN